MGHVQPSINPSEANTPKLLGVFGGVSLTDGEVEELLARLIRRSGKAREDIAKEMSALAGITISKRMIDAWTCPSKPPRFPAFLVPAFSEVIGNDELQRRLMTKGQRVCCEVGERILELQRHQFQNKGKGKRTRKV
jgi:hypothetical protein